MIPGERYVFKKKGKYKSWFLVLLIAAGTYGIYRYWPKISDLWKLKTDEIAERLAQIEAKSDNRNTAELNEIIQLIEKDTISNPRKTHNFLLLGQAYQSHFPKTLEEILLYFLKMEAGIESPRFYISQQENLEKSAHNLLRGFFLSGDEKERRLFRILLANNYLFRAPFFLSEISPLIRADKVTFEEFSNKEKNIWIFTLVRLGKVDELKKILDKQESGKDARESGRQSIIRNSRLILGLANYYARKWIYAIHYLKPYLGSDMAPFIEQELLAYFTGLVYLKNLEFRESEKMSQFILDKKKDSLLGYLLLGKIFLERKSPDNAGKAFLKVLEQNPRHTEALYLLKALGY